MLSWSNVANETSYTLFRSTNSLTTNAIGGVGKNVTIFTDTLSSLGKINYYFVKAYNLLGSSGYSPLASAFLPPPGQPMNLTAILTNQEILITFSDLTNESSYTLFKGLTNNPASYTWKTNLPQDQTNYLDTVFPANTNIYYWIRAYNGSGASPFSSVASTNLQPPPAPVWVSAIETGNLRIELTWQSMPNVSIYSLFHFTNNNSSSATNIGSALASQTSFTHNSPLVGQTNFYWIKAINRAGPSGFSASTNIFLQPPGTPAGLSGSIIADTTNMSIAFSWIDINNETSYTLFWSTNINPTNNKVGLNQDQTNYLHANLQTGQAYYYRVKAYNTLGESAYSTNFTITTPSEYPPQPPSFLIANAISGASIQLEWESVSNATSYTLFRNTVNDLVSAQAVAPGVSRRT